MIVELFANLIRVARYELGPRTELPSCSARITVIEGTVPAAQKG